MPTLHLPPAPAHLAGPVKAWRQAVSLPTWEPQPGERNPMFLEKRVYQGSSGRVYPLPFIDRIADTPVDRDWQAIHLENDYLRLMILPELGGRIHVARDKSNGYDFVYRQDVIKPALVGLAGPWVSGGIEFNWPQHHRPGTYLPVEATIENAADGSCTVWLSSYDPLSRMKGMHGVCLRPGRSTVELRVRLHNPTPLTQTFLWWANVATEVNEHYQSFFPEDVRFVADHAKRAISTFPRCRGSYYGVDYAARAMHGVAAKEQPRQFRPDGSYPPDDLSWYANIPVPTSYMCLGSEADFFGGYDHRMQAGIVHVADHRIAPGKKQWCWGNHEFGYAWDRLLTEPDALGVHRPYIELMAGVYTDNQPDFSFLTPGETRTFTQVWYPIRAIGPAHAANADTALSLCVRAGEGEADAATARLGVAVTARQRGARIVLAVADAMNDATKAPREIADWLVDLAPDRPFTADTPLPPGVSRRQLVLRVARADGRELIAYRPPQADAEAEGSKPPASASEPPPPQAIESCDELYVTGLHLEQYRHATRSAEAYWREALRRDPGDARCNTALGVWLLRRGEFAAAEAHLRGAIARLTRRNPNPADGEALYYLGLCLRYQARAGADREAYDAFYKASWNGAWRSGACLALAEIDACRGQWATALEHVRQALRSDADNLRARHLEVLALRRLGESESASEGKDDADAAHERLAALRALDPLDAGAHYLAGEALACDTQTRIDLASELASCGLYAQAMALLAASLDAAEPGTRPLLHYYLAAYAQRAGDGARAAGHRADAARACRDYCFPARLDDLVVLEDALRFAPHDAAAHYYLGNLLYDKRRHREAIAHWEASARLDASYPTVWRNLGIGRYNILNDADAARQAYETAWALDTRDARLLYERDQLWKRIGVAPAERLAELERHAALAASRDDLCVELAALYNHAGQPEAALALLAQRRFQPWEGGEGQALGQYVRTRIALGRGALDAGRAGDAVREFGAALNPPQSLGEARHPLANPSDILYWLGRAYQAAGRIAQASQAWREAAAFRGDFQAMSVRAYSEMSYFSALSLAELGEREAADALLRAIAGHAQQLLGERATIDYFATSLPTMLLFEDDLQRRQQAHARLMLAQAHYGLKDDVGAREQLAQVLAIDPNNALAIDLSRDLALPAAIIATAGDPPNDAQHEPHDTGELASQRS